MNHNIVNFGLTKISYKQMKVANPHFLQIDNFWLNKRSCKVRKYLTNLDSCSPHIDWSKITDAAESIWAHFIFMFKQIKQISNRHHENLMQQEHGCYFSLSQYWVCIENLILIFEYQRCQPSVKKRGIFFRKKKILPKKFKKGVLVILTEGLSRIPK